MSSAEFQRICRDLIVCAESVTIEVKKGVISFSCKGDIGNGSIQLKPTSNVDEDEDEQTVINLNQAVKLTFSLKYLVNFAKATPLSGSVTLKMSADVPLLVEYDMGHGHLRFYLAPKIADDDDDDDEEDQRMKREGSEIEESGPAAKRSSNGKRVEEEDEDIDEDVKEEE